MMHFSLKENAEKDRLIDKLKQENDELKKKLAKQRGRARKALTKKIVQRSH